MADFTDHCGDGNGEPAKFGFTVTASDEMILTDLCRALYIGTGGTLVVEMFNGTTLSFLNVPAGQFMPIRVRKVKSATTASGIIGLY